MSSKKYTLTVISGSKNVVFGVFDGDNLVKKYRIGSPSGSSADEYAAFLRSCFSQNGMTLEDVNGVILGITNHEVKRPLESMVKRVFNLNPIFVSEGTKTGVKIDYRSDSGFSADRVANIVAIKNYYTENSRATVVVDFGFKTVIDVIDKKGKYIGGIITVGEDMVNDGLANLRTSLPRVEYVESPKVIGNTLKRSLQSGCYWTVVYTIKGYLQDLKIELQDPNPKIIITGGYGESYIGYINHDCVDYDLTLRGLKLIYDRNVKKK
ncbi:MAG: type III pantothenate kinase [Proteobacteria bacterium]|nr:type III pantothenate kinase [Pseudomonadota bacterium]